jgi:hypothetical protein
MLLTEKSVRVQQEAKMKGDPKVIEVLNSN